MKTYQVFENEELIERLQSAKHNSTKKKTLLISGLVLLNLILSWFAFSGSKSDVNILQADKIDQKSHASDYEDIFLKTAIESINALNETLSYPNFESEIRRISEQNYKMSSDLDMFMMYAKRKSSFETVLNLLQECISKYQVGTRRWGYFKVTIDEILDREEY